MGALGVGLVLMATLMQGQGPDSTPATDSTEGAALVALGRGYLAMNAAYHTHHGPADTAWVRAVLDTADHAFSRAATAYGAPGASAGGDTARVLRVRVWSERALLVWERDGLGPGPETWGPPPPADLRLSPVLEELGENLLRSCPTGGVLLTGSDADSYAAWYMRYARGLRPDLLVLPWGEWRGDATFRARAAAELKPGRRTVCASMGFERPPDVSGGLSWSPRPLVWVAAAHPSEERVPPRDFVFAALKPALALGDPWAQAVLALYGRAVRWTRTLCEPLATFQVAFAIPNCRR